jgi:hypothetical protein
MGYKLEGRLLEVCNCRVLCPCWIGEDPDFGTCDSIMAWRMDKGSINGVDVAGVTFAICVFIPGNVLAGNWRAVAYVDDKMTPEQEEAVLGVYTGKLGGPVAELVKLIGEIVDVRRVPIVFDVDGGKGTVQIGDKASAVMEAYEGAMGGTTTLSNTIFSTVPGAPVFVSKALSYKSDHPEIGIERDLSGHNALQSTFMFEAA